MPTNEIRERTGVIEPFRGLKWMRTVLWAVCFLASVGFFLTLVIEQGFSSRVVKVQVVKIDATQHNPLGPITTDEGEPRLLIIADQQALMKGTTPTGLPKVDVDYLHKHPTAATTLPPILGLVGLARLGCLVAAAATLIGAFCLPRVRFLAENTQD